MNEEPEITLKKIECSVLIDADLVEVAKVTGMTATELLNLHIQRVLWRLEDAIFGKIGRPRA